MKLDTIQGYVVIPHQADWSSLPELDRQWRSTVEPGLTGIEDRAGFRSTAWQALQFRILPYDHVERALLEDRVRRGRKAGKAAVPHLSRGAKLASQASGTSATLDRTDHGWTVGEYVFFQSLDLAAYDTWDVAWIEAVAGAVLTLSDALSNMYAAKTWVWPFFFGKLVTEKFALLNRIRGFVPLTIQFQGKQILGRREPYDSFESYAMAAALSGLNGGADWTGAWAGGDGTDPAPPGNPTDDFESYALGVVSSPLNGGIGWESQWVLEGAINPEPPPSPYEDFESYALGSGSFPLNAGSGWTGDWVFADNA